MNYRTPSAFRTAIENRLNVSAAGKGAPALQRLRKMVVFDRFLARLLAVAPDRWILKGGVALDLRLGDRARSTKDLDLARQDTIEAATAVIVAVGEVNLGDHFSFAAKRVDAPGLEAGENPVRFQVTGSLAGRRFEQVVVDIGFSDPLPAEPDRLAIPSLLAFAGFPTTEVPSLPLEQHVAEKLHAYTRVYEGDRPSSRTKDLVDLVLILSTTGFDYRRLRGAIADTFRFRASHRLPTRLPPPPKDWAASYERLAVSVALDPDLATAHRDAAKFLDPVLSETSMSTAKWDPIAREWVETHG